MLRAVTIFGTILAAANGANFSPNPYFNINATSSTVDPKEVNHGFTVPTKNNTYITRHKENNNRGVDYTKVDRTPENSYTDQMFAQTALANNGYALSINHSPQSTSFVSANAYFPSNPSKNSNSWQYPQLKKESSFGNNQHPSGLICMAPSAGPYVASLRLPEASYVRDYQGFNYVPKYDNGQNAVYNDYTSNYSPYDIRIANRHPNSISGQYNNPSPITASDNTNNEYALPSSNSLFTAQATPDYYNQNYYTGNFVPLHINNNAENQFIPAQSVFNTENVIKRKQNYNTKPTGNKDKTSQYSDGYSVQHRNTYVLQK